MNWNLLRGLYQRFSRWYRVRCLPEQPDTLQPLNNEDIEYLLEFYPALDFASRDLVVYDIGAAEGTFTDFTSKWENVRVVHAFEPIPASYVKLQRIKEIHGDKVVCHKIGLGAEKSDLELNVYGDPSYSPTGEPAHPLGASSFLDATNFGEKTMFGNDIPKTIKETVPVFRLDDYVRLHGMEKPDLVKMDVQGFEDRIIKGGKETFSHCRSFVIEVSFEEFYEGQALFHDVYELMHSLGKRFIGFGNTPRFQSTALPQANAVFLHGRF